MVPPTFIRTLSQGCLILVRPGVGWGGGGGGEMTGSGREGEGGRVGTGWRGNLHLTTQWNTRKTISKNTKHELC